MYHRNFFLKISQITKHEKALLLSDQHVLKSTANIEQAAILGTASYTCMSRNDCIHTELS